MRLRLLRTLDTASAHVVRLLITLDTAFAHIVRILRTYTDLGFRLVFIEQYFPGGVILLCNMIFGSLYKM